MIKGPRLSLWEMARSWMDEQCMNFCKSLGKKTKVLQRGSRRFCCVKKPLCAVYCFNQNNTFIKVSK